ncbi:MAG: hypothetical protein ACC682_04835 [Gemmatimonadota bacterium]
MSGNGALGLVAVMAAALLPGSAPLVASQEPFVASRDGAWNSPRALEIVDRAIRARERAALEPGLSRFEARAQGHIYFLGEFRGEREVVRADQVALQIRWQAPNNAIQTIVGRRHEIRLPTRIQYHIDHLSIVLDNLGDRIVLGDGDEVWGVLHPAAPGAPREYEYRLADSLEIRILDRTARVYRLEVRPLDPSRAAVVGSMYVDRESGAIARLRITFTSAAYRDEELDSIALDLRSALWEGKFWLPAEQDVEIKRSLSWLDFPLASIIRTRLIVQEYDLDPEGDWDVGPGKRVTTLSQPELDDFWLWDSPLYAGPLERGDRSDQELDLALRNARALVRPGALRGDDQLQFSLPNASSGLRLRRAEGALVGGGGKLNLGEMTSLSLWAGYATGLERLEGSATLDRRLGDWRGRLEGFAHGYRDVGPFVAASGVGQSLGLVIEREDYSDPYFEDGGRVSFARMGAGVKAEAGVSVRRQRSARLVVESIFAAGGALRPVRPIDEGDLAALNVAIDVPLGTALGARWSVGLEGEAATSAIGDFGYTRGTLTLLAARDGLGAPWGWRSELVIGGAGGDLPAQRLFLLGGRGTLPGYDFRGWGGSRVAMWRGEVSREVAWPWINVRAVGSAGRVDATRAGAGAAERFGVIPTGGVRTSVGGGLGLFYDMVRLEVVKGLGGARADDPIAGDWAVLLTINPRFWDVL